MFKEFLEKDRTMIIAIGGYVGKGGKTTIANCFRAYGASVEVLNLDGQNENNFSSAFIDSSKSNELIAKIKVISLVKKPDFLVLDFGSSDTANLKSMAENKAFSMMVDRWVVPITVADSGHVADSQRFIVELIGAGVDASNIKAIPNFVKKIKDQSTKTMVYNLSPFKETADLLKNLGVSMSLDVFMPEIAEIAEIRNKYGLSITDIAMIDINKKPDEIITDGGYFENQMLCAINNGAAEEDIATAAEQVGYAAMAVDIDNKVFAKVRDYVAS